MQYSNPALRSSYETEIASKQLDPIEGFWESKNDYAEGVGVIYRVDPATNEGFPFAARAIEIHQTVTLPYRWPDPNQIGGRWKPTTTPSVYEGQVLMTQGNRSFWKEATGTLIDPTTVEVTFHVSGPVLGGSTQRGHLIGPSKELERRLQATAQASQAKSGVPVASAGSGFVIGRSLVVTNYHVIREAKAI